MKGPGEDRLSSGGQRATVHPRWAIREREPVRRAGSYQYLLDHDVELAEALDVRMRLVARPAATAVIFDAEAGEIGLADQLGAACPGPGLLILEGVLAVNTRVGGRTAAELLGPGDLVESCEREAGDLLASGTEWRGLHTMRFAVLDGGFARRVRPWPQISHALLRRVQRRAHNLNVQRAIACQPRLDVRLALLLWHLAARWGRVEPGGIRLPLPLTHQLLGRLIGAERPSVSHALARLARSGLVTGHGDEWHLNGEIEEQLAAKLHAGADGVAPLLAARGST